MEKERFDYVMQRDCDIKNELKRTIEWMLIDEKGKPICNFIPDVQTVLEVEFDTKVKKYVKLNLQFQNNEQIEAFVLLDELENTEWNLVCERCIVNSCNKNAKGIIGSTIRNDLYKASYEKRYGVERTGLHRMNDTVFFFTGKDIMVREDDNELKTKIWVEGSPLVLDIDSDISLKESFDGMWELINLVPGTGVILLAHAIYGIMQQAYRDAGFNPCTILEVVGESGMFKTTYVPQIVQLYNRSKGIRPETRFNSTNRFIEDLLCFYYDCTIVIDDLHTAQSSEIKRKNEVTAEEIIRRISDNTGQGHKEGNAMVQREFRANVVFTGEYIIGQESTASRLLVVKMSKRPDGKILDRYQREKPLLVSTFYYYFIRWYLENYKEVVDEINRQLTRFRSDTMDFSIHGRLRDSKFYLQTSFMFFLQFSCESGFLHKKEAICLHKKFDTLLNALIQEQQDRIGLNHEKKGDMGFMEFIRKMYKSKKIFIAKSVETYNPEVHDGLIYYECLCIRREILDKIVRKFNPCITVDEVVRKLIAANALKLVGDKRTVKISTLNKGVGSIRFYAIWLHALELN